MTDKRFAIRVMAGAAMFLAILLLSMVGTASAAHAFAYGFRGPSVITETSQKDPMFQTEHMHDFFCANNVTDPTSYDALVGGAPRASERPIIQRIGYPSSRSTA